MQELLTELFEFIFVSFTVILVFDFTAGLNHLLPPVRPQNAQDAAPNTNAIPTSVCSSSIALTTSPEPLVMLPDPWTLPIEEQVTPLSSSSQPTTKFKPLLLLPPAQSRLDLTALKKYVLHGKPVVRVEDIAIGLPDGLKHCKLRGQSVLHLADLEAAMASRAWLAAYGSLS